MAPFEEEKANQIQWQALGDQARGFTYCLIDRADQKIGTAIAIQLGRRFFFATAKHVIENSHDIAILLRGEVPNTVSDFAGKYYDEQLDIGLLELTPDNAHCFKFSNIAQLPTTIDMNTELPCLVVGYPRQFINTAEVPLNGESGLRVCRCDSLPFQSVVLPQSEWPDNNSLEKPLVAGRDLLVDFDPEPRVTPLPPGVLLPDASPMDCSQVDPHGLSGGGIWLAQVEDRNGLCIPDIRLIGIQTSWFERKGWLRGVRIEAWLNLVRSKYPDLAEEG